jgi:hypothetical protein
MHPDEIRAVNSSAVPAAEHDLENRDRRFWPRAEAHGRGEMTIARRTMTLNLTEAEMQLLDELSTRKETSKTALLKQALRLYHILEARAEKGDKLVFENEATKERKELMFL